ncbi:MAG: hypothetical protein HN400_04800, partial [Nitrospinaceae bacterium]|nr:hypothetical protein [Nitrospinaceae bacterium]
MLAYPPIFFRIFLSVLIAACIFLTVPAAVAADRAGAGFKTGQKIDPAQRNFKGARLKAADLSGKNLT